MNVFSLPGAVAAKAAPAVLAASVSLSLALAGCGGSSSASHGTSHTTSHAAGTPASASAPVTGAPRTGARSLSTKALHATLVGMNHAPKVGQAWPYWLKVSTRSGKPVSGQVAIDFMLAGAVVAHDQPATHPITDGAWHGTLTFPSAAAGYPLTLRATAHTGTGSISLDWPITVQKA